MKTLRNVARMLNLCLTLGAISSLTMNQISAQEQQLSQRQETMPFLLSLTNDRTRLNTPSDADAPALAFEDTLNQKSETMATALSLLGIFVPSGIGLAMVGGGVKDSELPTSLIISGVFIGPSIGYIAAGEPWKGLAGVGIRLGAGVFMGRLLMSAVVQTVEKGSSDKSTEVLFIIAGGLIIGHALYDALNAGNYVKQKNDERRQRLHVQVSPSFSVHNGSTGIAVQLMF